MSDQMSDQLREGDTEVITWSAFLTELGMPPALRELSERQMRYGICSEPACQWPIAGWCVMLSMLCVCDQKIAARASRVPEPSAASSRLHAGRNDRKK